MVSCVTLKRPPGFTLIELMIVVAIIAILATVAIPKFADLVTKSREASIRGDLGGLRSAVSIYYSENEMLPTTITNCLEVDEHYIGKIAPVTIPSNTAFNNPGHNQIGGDTAILDDMATAGWLYMPLSADNFLLTINCSHEDLRGVVWSEN